MPDLYATSRQGSGQVAGGLVRPPQTSHRIAGRRIPQQLLQQLPHTRRFFSTRFRPPPGRRTRSEDSACPRSLSRNPRRIVMRLRPVISATCWTPPCPRCRANIPANNRRLRSSNSAITRLMARWYATKSRIAARPTSSATTPMDSPALLVCHDRLLHPWKRNTADYTNGQLIFEQRRTLRDCHLGIQSAEKPSENAVSRNRPPFPGKFGRSARKPRKSRVFQGFVAFSPILVLESRTRGNPKKTGDRGCQDTRQPPRPPLRLCRSPELPRFCLHCVCIAIPRGTSRSSSDRSNHRDGQREPGYRMPPASPRLRTGPSPSRGACPTSPEYSSWARPPSRPS